MNDIDKNKLLEEYCSDNMKKLKQICFPKIQLMGGISQMDHDDLYSIALDTLRDSVERYVDSKDCKFSTFLNNNIQNRFNTYLRDKNRKKQIPRNKIKYIDASTDDGIDDCEKIDSGFCIEDKLSDEIGFLLGENIQEYFKSLSERQRKIAELIMLGFTPIEIKEKLNLTEKQYISSFKDMQSFKKRIILKHEEIVSIEEDKQMQECSQTLEKSKPDKLSIASIIKKINNYTIRFDHPLQRESEQWSPAMKGNLISDILQRNPIPPLVFAEQVVNGLAIIWDLDGKQRCTNIYSFGNDGYKITKNIRRWNISYQARIADENGKLILDENGFPQSEKREFDIRGKKFSDLPDELKDRYLEYNFEIVQYLNCSSEDIAYHIARYNEGKPMTASQKGITRLGEEFASMVKSISAMSFFKELGGYKVSESNNGIVNRVVIESVMAANFLDDWKKKQEDMCEYMKENATSDHFDKFEDMVEKISSIGTKDVFNMFDSKDSFIYFGLFARFINTGLEDERFIEFMSEFSRSLHKKRIDGITYDDLNEKSSTKDKNIVIGKIEHLEKIMMDFLNISIEENQPEIIETTVGNSISVIDFIRDNVCQNITEEDINDYEEDLEVLSLDVDSSSKLLEYKNHNSLIALIAYTYQSDINPDEWFIGFFKKNNTYIKNQKENYLHMKADLNKFIEFSERKVAV